MKPRELIKALVDRDGGALPVAKAMGRAGFQSTIFRFINGETLSPERRTAEKIARHYKLAVDVLYDDKLAGEAYKRLFEAKEHPVTEGGNLSHVGQELIHPTIKDEPTKLSWEFILSGAVLPPWFEAAVPDDALSPRTTRGTSFIFSSTATPRDGDVVVVQSGAGRRYMRLWFAVGADEWEARTRDPAQPPLHSIRDALELLAVATHRAGGQG